MPFLAISISSPAHHYLLLVRFVHVVFASRKTGKGTEKRERENAEEREGRGGRVRA